MNIPRNGFINEAERKAEHMAKQAKQKLSSEELSGFCAQVAMLLNAGMALYDGMETLAQTHQGSPSAAVYERISREVTASGSLYEALKSQEAGAWPVYLVEMVGIGERTGRLEEIMNGLSAYYDRESRIRRAVTSAVTYPLVLCVMMLLIILVMVVKVLPVFRGVLSNMGLDMSASGSMMMNLGADIGTVVLAAMGLVVAAAVACVLLVRTRHRKRVIDLLRRAFPPLRRITRRLASSRIASVLSMMISGGFPLDEALDMVPAVLPDDDAREQIARVRTQVEEGLSLGDALTKADLFDELHSSMIRASCTVGSVDTVMARVAGNYEERVEDGIAGLVSIIEPTLVGVLSVVIGAVLLSVMLPMVGIISSIL